MQARLKGQISSNKDSGFAGAGSSAYRSSQESSNNGLKESPIKQRGVNARELAEEIGEQMLDQHISFNDGIPAIGDNTNLRSSLKSMMRDRICIRPYVREDTTTIVPNTVDEDLNMGPE